MNAATSPLRKVLILLCALAVPMGLAAEDQANKPRHHHYKLIDMGTFGGPASSINEPVFLGNLNNKGVATGWSATSVPALPTSSFLVCGGLDNLVPYITHTLQWKGTVTDLGALPPSATNCSEPFFINSKGEIVGASETADIDPQFFGLKQIHAVLWKDGQIIDLGSLGGHQAAAFAINSRGQIAGNSTTTIPDPFCFFKTLQLRTFLWQNGQMQDLGSLGGSCGSGIGTIAINERGQVIGNSSTSNIPNPVTGLPPFDPFIWEEGKGMTDLGTLGGAFGAAQDINNRGQVIGQSSIASDPGACNGFPDNNDLNCHAFLWENGTLIDLTVSSIGGAPDSVAAINDAGEIVGTGVFPNAPLEAFLWRKGVATDLGNLGECASFAHTVNAQGQVVGLAASCDGGVVRAFLWEDGSIVDLNTLIPSGSSLQLADASTINDSGEITGTGTPPGIPTGNFLTQGHGFLLIPCDEGHPDIEGCDYRPVEVSTVATSHATETQKQLTPQEISRIRDLLMNRHRGFVPRTVH